MTDPDELLEVLDSDGRPTGVAKPRGSVHLEGDWHLAFFCWIVRRGSPQTEGPELVLQRRAETKDVWPGRFDASAAGHYRFGESLAHAVREVREELGLHVEIEELVSLPRHRQQHRHANGIVDREFHDLHLWRCDLDLESYRPSLSEVSGLVALPATAIAELAEGARPAIEAEIVRFDRNGRAERHPLVLRRDDLVPYDEGYHRLLAERAAQLV